jgi:hypothetical protein
MLPQANRRLNASRQGPLVRKVSASVACAGMVMRPAGSS